MKFNQSFKKDKKQKQTQYFIQINRNTLGKKSQNISNTRRLSALHEQQCAAGRNINHMLMQL